MHGSGAFVGFVLVPNGGQKSTLIVTVCSPGPAQSPETGDREGREKVTKQLSQKQDQLHNLQGWV